MSGRPAMVMQWYANGNAAEYLRKNPDADRQQLILDVACGLAYLHTHKHPIVHADLKGNNVLITDDGRAAISDFGLSNVLEELGRPTGYTLSNPGIGPLRWLAPELMEHDEQPAMPASDVWSFGCTAYELLTGLIPYSHRHHDPQVVMDVQKRIKPFGPDIPKEFLQLDSRIQSLLKSCWSFSPEERPIMTDVRKQLEQICCS
ncbi:kinase-like domain-containing protein [Gymnopilus junonius]|uniref:Kinase-like domain-containing protein n=1 Tax=Gymnopilus junonius TaxID=109634 RepID=A0A9P5NIT3_GYMJU|nr:kinase-like domain-containing protein [Gymnopilus junonius]